MTSATVETFVIGDVTGEFTGDAPGEVILTNYISGWNDTPSGDAINLAGRDYLTFKYLTILTGAAGNCVDGATVHSSNIILDTCFIESMASIPIAATASFATALNWTIRNCYVVAPVSIGISTTQTLGSGADYDLNLQISDCHIVANSNAVRLSSAGSGANEGGGVDVLRCSLISAGSPAFSSYGTANSLTYPCTIQDSCFWGATGISAGEAGAITDLGGNVVPGGLTNVTAHATTRTGTHDFPAMFVSMGHEWMWGMEPRRLFTPMLPGSFNLGHIGSATTDMTGKPRPSGGHKWIDSGTATAGAATTITDSGKAWKTNEHLGRLVRITGGTGSGQVKHISSNTATVLTIGGISGDWATTPSTDSAYVIYEGPPVETGKATSGSTTTVVDSGAAWSVNKWAGYTCAIIGGTGNGESKTISSNTSTTLTTAAFVATLDSTSVYSIFWPGGSLTATGKFAGAFENHDSAAKETSVTDAGSVGITIHGPGNHEFLIPVDAASTTISVKMRYDSNHGTTNKPRAVLVANPEIGVTTETKTMTSAADTWETLTFSAQTPSAKGVVVVRLESRSDVPYGRAYADTWTVT